MMLFLLSACLFGSKTCTDVVEVSPADGDAIAYDGVVEVTLDPPDSSATLGSSIGGTSRVRGDTVRWTPATPLTPGSRFNVTLNTCDGDVTTDYTFHVAPADPLGGGNQVNGKAWDIQLPGVLTTLGLSTFRLASTGGSRRDLVFAIINQPCIELPSVDFSQDPYFSIRPEDTTLPFDDGDVPVSDFQFSGTLVDGGDRMIGVTMGFTIDLRETGISDREAEDVCTAIGVLGYQCRACRDGSDYCADIVESNLTGEPWGGGPWCQ